MHDGIFREEAWTKLERPERLKNLDMDNVLQKMGIASGNRIADLGSGTGIFIPSMLQLAGPSGRVYAVERSTLLIERMLAKFPQKPENLTILQQDLMELEWEDAPVDRALLCHVAHELPDLEAFFRLAGAAVAEGGLLCVVEWQAKEQTSGPPISKRIPPTRLAAMLRNAGWLPEGGEDIGEDFYILMARRVEQTGMKQ